MSEAKAKVLYLGPRDQLSLVEKEIGGAYEVVHASTDDEIDQVLKEVGAVLDADMRFRFGADRLERAQALRVVVTATTGADHIDSEHLAARQIPLLTLRGEREVLRDVTAAAEHSWLLLLAAARQLIPATRSVLHGEWNRNRFPGAMLRGKTLGVVGCGRIGQWMARYAHGFGMNVVGYDPHLKDWPEVIRKLPLDDVCRAANFVSIHVPLNKETHGLIGAREIGLLRRGAILVNTSRGEVVDEAALIVALESGQLSAAAVDVLRGEPDIDGHPLVEWAKVHDNLVITPHIGGFSPDAVAHVLRFSCGRVREALAES